MNDREQRDPRFSVGGPFLRGQGRSAVGLGGAFVWLALIVFPVISAVGRRGPELRHWLAVTGAGVFVAAYILPSWRGSRSLRSASASRVIFFTICSVTRCR